MAWNYPIVNINVFSTVVAILHHVNLEVFYFDLLQRMQVVEMVVGHVANIDKEYFDVFRIAQSWFQIAH